MMCVISRPVVALIGLVVCAAIGASDNLPNAADRQQSPQKYTLRYKFGPGETLRWKVVHRARVDATVNGVSQSSESVSSSIKVWKVCKVEPKGTATFEQRVENVDMWQKLSGRSEVRYNSQRDKQPPPGFETVAKSVGVPLMRTTIDPKGKILNRQALSGRAKPPQEGLLTIPLPDAPVAVGETWTYPSDIDIPLESGGIKQIKSRQSFTLEEVKDSVATVRVATQILTPVDDPAIEAQLVQRDSTGTVSFDIDAGRVVAQRMDTDKRVVGFRGQASSLHYRTQFTEELLSPSTPGEASQASASVAASKASPAPAAKPDPSTTPKTARRTKTDATQRRK